MKHKADQMSEDTHTHDNTQNISSTRFKILTHAEGIEQLHCSMGHRSVKGLIQLKKHNKAIVLLYRQGCYLREDEYICRSMGLVLNTRLKTPTGSVETESNTYIQSKN